MGELSVYFVPDNQQKLVGKSRQIAEALWALGVFVATEDQFIYKRIQDWKAARKPLPKGNHDFSFGDMGIADKLMPEPVPNLIYDLKCPRCAAEMMNETYDIWNKETETPIPDRPIRCPKCSAVFPSREIKSEEMPFTFARFYLWVSDIDEEDWDPAFKETVQNVVGPCREFRACET